MTAAARKEGGDIKWPPGVGTEEEDTTLRPVVATVVLEHAQGGRPCVILTSPPTHIKCNCSSSLCFAQQGRAGAFLMIGDFFAAHASFSMFSIRFFHISSEVDLSTEHLCVCLVPSRTSSSSSSSL